ncbi:hypothetical protein D3C86_2152090 [compost metagenome]
MSQLHNGPDDRRIPRIGGNIAEEQRVDLEDAGGHLPQIRQARIAGPEVADR